MNATKALREDHSQRPQTPASHAHPTSSRTPIHPRTPWGALKPRTSGGKRLSATTTRDEALGHLSGRATQDDPPTQVLARAPPRSQEGLTSRGPQQGTTPKMQRRRALPHGKEP